MNKQEIEKALKHVDDKLSGFSEDGKLRKIYASIREALTQQLNNGWIPVSERLPEDTYYPPVNCCNVNDKWSDSAIMTGTGEFINSENCIIYPTHWKPLPSWEEVSK